VADSSRIDELRSRLEKEPGSRLFAQLGEELRKAGDLGEAIDVCRAGLETHPTYSSARMTLGRALQDSGDLSAAIPEYEAVLKAAADNILASRLLAECLEGVGDLKGAAARCRSALVLAPGDKQLQGRLSELEAKLQAPAGAAVAAPPATADVEGPTVRARALASDAPIPLVAAEESFELEAPYQQGFPTEPMTPPMAPEVEPASEAVGQRAPSEALVAPGVVETELPAPEAVVPPPVAEALAAPAPEAAPPAPAPQPPAEAAPHGEPPSPDVEEFDFETPRAEREAVASPAASQATPVVVEPTAEAEPPPEVVPELASSTLAELYFNQGHTERAIDVYQQLVEREPANERAAARLKELRALESHLKAEEQRAPAAPALDPRAARRAAIERTIARLEGLLASVKRG
jgi:tetratricopeptide (TPR) repeat protein